MTDRSKLLDDVVAIAREAGECILEVYNRDDFDVEKKGDDSPLTAADLAAHRTIVAGLEKLTPDIPVHSEESQGITWEMRRDWQRYWLVDPLDGTKEFVKRNGEFTVNIALVENGEPVAGVVFQPVVDRLYWAARGQGAWLSVDGGDPQKLRGGPHYTEADSVVVVASRSHMSDEVKVFVAGLEAEGKAVEFHSSGSSLKLCLVAEGAAHVYPRLGPTMEWDTGAADAVAREAGKQVLNWETRQPLQYNKEDLLNPWFIVE